LVILIFFSLFFSFFIVDNLAKWEKITTKY
jgi:hypothetical protein